MKLTKHARIRSQQRGISNSEIDLILRFGETQKMAGDAIAYQIKGKTKNQLISNLKHQIQSIEKLEGEVVIVSKDGVVITAYHS